VEAEVREEPSGVANRVERERKGGTGDIPRRVLVVDDNEDSAEAMALLLQRFGHDVTVAFSGSSSIELMGMGPTQPEIVFLDLELPDMHGTQVAQLMRANGFSGKVIALSGHSEHSIKERCAKAGIDHFLCKPCSVQDLRTLM
jgi:CheY-like chemotaxis protein